MELHISRHWAASLTALAAAALLGACDRQDTTAARDRADTTVAQAEQKTERAAESAANSTREAAKDAKDATAAAADSAGDKVKDATITAAVKSKLAADPNLSALAIDVDTSAGRVALNGSAPDAAAKEKATTLASSVDGVVSVDNQLSVATR